MMQGASTFGTLVVPRQPVQKKLALRRDLPPRVRHILAGLLGICTRSLADSIGAALDEYERELPRQATKARSIEQSRRWLESLREVKRARDQLTPRFLANMEDALARFDEGTDARSAAPGQNAAQYAVAELSLVETGDLELSLAAQEIATRSETRHSLALLDLGHRFGVLAGQPAVEAERMILGPAHVLRALRDASGCLDLPAEHRVLFCHAFDRVALSAIGPFYAELNAFFVEHRILRHLRAHAPVRPRSKSGSPAQQAGANAARLHGDTAAPQSLPSARISSESSSSNTNPELNDPELFTTLRQLLAGRPRAPGARIAATPGSRGYVPSTEDVQSVLGRLQSKRAAPVQAGDDVAGRSVTHLKQELLDQLHQFAPPGQRLQLDAEDSDTIDLVGMLFDYIEKSAPANGSTRKMMTQLQVPLLRVALRDKSFFSQGSHPARLLLNAIAETGIHWIDDSDGEADPVLLKKMHLVIERLNAEFDGDLSLVERMLGDLSQHVQTLAHKAEVSERRLVDASKGREKLGLARETASNAIAARVAVAKPGRLMRTMLEQAWTDVLALSVLRHGEDSEPYQKLLAVTDQLIAAGGGKGITDQPAIAALRQEVEKGLGQVGFHHDEIQAVVRHLLAPGEATQEDDQPSQTQVAIRLKTKTHLGHAAGEEKPLQAAAVRRASLQLNAAELHMLERLRSMPFGTWFEFATNQQGDRARRKLSWYSTITGRCLFVNPRGARAFERTLEQLAREVVRGQANIAAPEKESLVDRAWNAIVASLRHLSRQPAGTVPAAR
ncbi:MAG TPA: DUF1631 domain-containing protein [Rudaea sp.]|jgi:hypothetical protein|nr:DUF1631 domain-containing protein [Rudaea sp.]